MSCCCKFGAQNLIIRELICEMDTAFRCGPPPKTKRNKVIFYFMKKNLTVTVLARFMSTSHS